MVIFIEFGVADCTGWGETCDCILLVLLLSGRESERV